VQKSAGKVLASIFWDQKRRGKITKGVLFLHDNVPTHLARAFLGFQCLDHPPYSPDLAPSNYHLFPGLKKKLLKGRHFSSDTEVIAAAETWLGRQLFEFFFFLSGLQKLEQRAKMFIELRGEYVE
jgi:histone-lysine N-methyltransferase SETMAR